MEEYALCVGISYDVLDTHTHKHICACAHSVNSSDNASFMFVSHSSISPPKKKKRAVSHIFWS